MVKILSILICSLKSREQYLKLLLNCLNKQKTEEIEIIIETDNGELTVGQKRNILLSKATGLYITFIDDDDLVSNNYIELILKFIYKSYPDVIGIHLLMTQDGQNEERTYHSLKYKNWWNESDPDRPGKQRYFRNPNHLNPVKKEYAIKAGFPNISYGEDRIYSANLLQYLKTEECIEQPIYYYLCRSNKNV